MEQKQWCVVEFDDGVQLVPIHWIKANECYWPLFKSSLRYTTAVKNFEEPQEDWPMYKMSILGTYCSYEVARKKLLVAEEQTDLSTDCEASKKSRKSRKKRQLSSDTSEDEMEPALLRLKPFPQAPTPCLNTNSQNVTQPTKQIKTSLVDAEYTLENVILSTKQNKTLRVDTECTTSKSSSSSIDLAMANSMVLEKSTANDEEFQNKVKRDLSFIKMHLIKLSQGVDALNKKHYIQEENFIEEDDVLQDFPLATEEKLEEMEERLKSVEFKTKLIDKLAKIGGHGVDNRTKLLLQRLFSDKLAAKFSWLGAKKKQVFSKLMYATIILNIVQRKEGCSEQEVVICIKNWLRHAPTRSNNKEKKVLEEQT